MENLKRQLGTTILTLIVFLAGYGLACKTIDNHTVRIDSADVRQIKDIPVLPAI